jgi:hypothetical protein
MKVMRLDIDQARTDYLRSPYGAQRHIQHLGTLIRLGEEAGARFSWAKPEDIIAVQGRPAMGMTGLGTRDVLLNFDLFKHYDWVIRFVFAHEIGHCVHGFSETKATR